MPRIRSIRRPSPAMAVALLALFVALGGASYAAIALPADSVGASQLKDSAVTSVKIGTGAVTTRAIRDKNVGLKALADKAVGQRALADQAVNGAKIASRAVGVSDINDQAVGTRALASKSVSPAKLDIPYTSVVAYSTVIPTGQQGYRNVRAKCPKNNRVISGGGGWVGPTTTDPLETASFFAGSRAFPPSSPSNEQTQWEIYGNDASPGSRRLMVIALCIPKS